jgi:hypothetical protein
LKKAFSAERIPDPAGLPASCAAGALSRCAVQRPDFFLLPELFCPDMFSEPKKKLRTGRDVFCPACPQLTDGTHRQ